MRLLQTEIKGPAKAVIIGILIGVSLGAIGGCLYGKELERQAIQAEMREIQAGRVNYKATDGKPPEKILIFIRAAARVNGLRMGVPVGGVAGMLAGAAFALLHRRPEKLTNAT